MEHPAKVGVHSPLIKQDIQFIRQGQSQLTAVGTSAPQEMFSILNAATSRGTVRTRALTKFMLLFLKGQNVVDPFYDMETFLERQ